MGVVLPRGGGIVLVRRKYEPFAGLWSLPAGFMEYGESPEQTAKREILEETGFKISLEGLVGAYRGADDPRVRVVLLIYRGKILAGRMRAGDDAAAIDVFSLDQLPKDLAFRSHRRALHDYKRILARQLH